MAAQPIVSTGKSKTTPADASSQTQRVTLALMLGLVSVGRRDQLRCMEDRSPCDRYAVVDTAEYTFLRHRT